MDEAGREFLDQLDVTGGGLYDSPSIRRLCVRGKRLFADGAIPAGLKVLDSDVTGNGVVAVVSTSRPVPPSTAHA